MCKNQSCYKRTSKDIDILKVKDIVYKSSNKNFI